MTSDEAKQLIEEDTDFVYMKRFNFSLARVIERYPDGAPDRVVAQALFLTEDEVGEIYQQIVLKLRTLMGIPDDLV